MNAQVDRDTLFHSYRYLCRRGARKFLRHGVERCDLEQVAAIGLLKACGRFDARNGAPFEAFAWLMVVGELMHFVRDHERPIRLPRWIRRMERARTRAHETLVARLQREPTDSELACELGVSRQTLDELRRALSASTTTPLEDERSARQPLAADCAGREELSLEDRLALEDALASLSEVEHSVIFGIYRTGLSQAEVAERVALSPRHVSRVHRRAIESLQRAWSDSNARGHSQGNESLLTRPGAARVKTIKGRIHDQRGFTLLELMIVVAIIAIIAAILVPNFFHARAQAAVSACEANMRTIATAAELFYTDNQRYPATAAAVDATSEFMSAAQKYLTQVPHDPGAATSADTYAYTNNGVNAGYTIVCPGLHPGTSVVNISGGANVAAGSSAHIQYDSTNGFSAVAAAAGH